MAKEVIKKAGPSIREFVSVGIERSVPMLDNDRDRGVQDPRVQ